MSQNASFIRKIIYGCGIIALLFPLYLLGQPSTSAPDSAGDGSGGAPGGVLAQMRSKYGLSQAELGQIDPASETMKMATLGLRAFASQILWTKANTYKKTESWDRFAAVLKQISRLQPNYISVWEFQAHNMAYNVSAEFDDYRARYHWVLKGLDLLLEGTKYNQRNPRLYWNLGWFTGHKMGISDEKVQYRQMFRDDTDFHNSLLGYIPLDSARGVDGKPDSWLVGWLWYLQAHSVAEKGVPDTWVQMDANSAGYGDKRRSAVIFYSDPPMALMSYAEAVTEEMIPGEKTRSAWKGAGTAWKEFGDMDIPTTFEHTVRLSNRDRLKEEVDQLHAKLEAMAPGLREKIRAERKEKLAPEERVAFDTYEERKRQLTEDEAAAFSRAYEKLTVTDMDLAEAMPEELRATARAYAMQAMQSSILGERTGSYATIVNYDYWKTRSEVEASKVTADARRFMMLADQKRAGAAPEEAKELYEQAWTEWAKILEQYPQLVERDLADDLKEVILRYKLVLDQLDEEFPKDFKLQVLAQQLEEDAAMEAGEGAPPPPPGGQGGDPGQGPGGGQGPPPTSNL
jgi:hypothetical protein